MKKAEFIDAVASKAGVSKKDANEVVTAALDAIVDALKVGESVNFVGFGSFSVADRAARDARVPGTDRIVKVPASKVAKFKAGKGLKEALNS
jgi:DNA-binding protein HU-beta